MVGDDPSTCAVSGYIYVQAILYCSEQCLDILQNLR